MIIFLKRNIADHISGQYVLNWNVRNFDIWSLLWAIAVTYISSAGSSTSWILFMKYRLSFTLPLSLSLTSHEAMPFAAKNKPLSNMTHTQKRLDISSKEIDWQNSYSLMFLLCWFRNKNNESSFLWVNKNHFVSFWHEKESPQTTLTHSIHDPRLGFGRLSTSDWTIHIIISSHNLHSSWPGRAGQSARHLCRNAAQHSISPAPPPPPCLFMKDTIEQRHNHCRSLHATMAKVRLAACHTVCHCNLSFGTQQGTKNPPIL